MLICAETVWEPVWAGEIIWVLHDRIQRRTMNETNFITNSSSMVKRITMVRVSANKKMWIKAEKVTAR